MTRENCARPLSRQFAVLVALLLVPTMSFAADVRDNVVPEGAVDLFAAIEAGDIEANLVVKNGEQARLIARNNTKRPLTIKLPEAIAAVPVLAQNQGGAGGGGGQGFFNVPPEKVAKHDLGFLCLEHGKPDPRASMEYQIKPLETITTDPKVVEAIYGFANGRYGHSAAQAAVWHLQNGLTWQELAAKRLKQLNGTSQPYFNVAELRQATNIVAHVTKIVQQREKSGTSTAASEN